MVYQHIIHFFKTILRSDSDQDLADKLLFGAYIYLTVVFVQSYFFPAPYGKFTCTSVSLIDRLRTIEFPARTSWIVMEIPSFLVSLSAFLHLVSSRTADRPLVRMVLLAPFTLHYLNRSLIFPLSASRGRPFPLLASGSAFLFTFYNGVLQSHFILSLAKLDDLQPVLSLLGLLLFSWGMFINIQSDNILQGLRKEGETGYKIPHGGMFRLVSSPNYMGEIIEWIGYAMIAQTAASLWFALFSLMFLGWRAVKTHQWYHDKFKEEYPLERKAFIPFLL